MHLPRVLIPLALAATGHTAEYRPGTRLQLDAHNCFPYPSAADDRLGDALKLGLPIAVEQDLIWDKDPQTGAFHSVVAHSRYRYRGEPSLKRHFFERVRPLIEHALSDPHPATWPLFTLYLDFKTDELDHHREVWKSLAEYRGWLSSAIKAANTATVQPLDLKPILVFTGASRNQQAIYYDAVPLGSRLYVFGASSGGRAESTNYRRWIQIPWTDIEAGGPPGAGEWSQSKQAKLKDMVSSAQRRGLFVRVHTLDGVETGPLSFYTKLRFSTNEFGWSEEYNFGSLDRVKVRWRAAIEAGADYIATDQYAELAAMLKAAGKR